VTRGDDVGSRAHLANDVEPRVRPERATQPGAVERMVVGDQQPGPLAVNVVVHDPAVTATAFSQ
jgi:hypothetical protein